MLANAAAASLALLCRLPALADGDGGSDGDGGGGSGAGASGASGASGAAGAAGAGDSGVDHDQVEMEQARKAQAELAAVPLSRAMGHALAMVPGQVLNVDLYHQKRGPLGYHIVVLSKNGRYVDIYIDAATNHLISRSSR
ncbi:MAG: hypothetical protein KGQ37_06190 [Hyphomicrobiales bacterium]|nr:hypothetical protein [Hyphomicrobiales bacterium]